MFAPGGFPAMRTLVVVPLRVRRPSASCSASPSRSRLRSVRWGSTPGQRRAAFWSRASSRTIAHPGPALILDVPSPSGRRRRGACRCSSAAGRVLTTSCSATPMPSSAFGRRARGRAGADMPSLAACCSRARAGERLRGPARRAGRSRSPAVVMRFLVDRSRVLAVDRLDAGTRRQRRRIVPESLRPHLVPSIVESYAADLQHAAPAELRQVFRILGIPSRKLRLLRGVEAVEVAAELVEPLTVGSDSLRSPTWFLPNCAGGVAEALHHSADRGIELAHPHRRAGEADLGQPGAQAVLAGEEGGAAGGAALLAVVLQEADPLLADAVDVGRWRSP